MCLQCAAGAATAVGCAAGIRVWLAASLRARIKPAQLRVLTISLLVLAVLAAGSIPAA